ncbi:MAG: hypothetical protein N3C12_05000 [Candidatus Binatia bacterium]|nr:hypothetical protein [Candidatus Binatia bacterium]
MRRSLFAVPMVLGLFVSAGFIPGAVAEGDPPAFEQPEDPQAKLRELDDVVLQKQRALFAARMRGNPEEIKKAQEEFEAVQKQRSKTVRAIENPR